MLSLLEQHPTFTIYAICFLASLGVLVWKWGEHTPGKGLLLIGFGFLALIAGLEIDSGFLFQQNFTVKTWIFEWILPKTDSNAIQMGIFEDPLGVILSAFWVLVASIFILSFSQFATSVLYAALAISISGVVLAWCSLTPWVCFFGIMLTLVGHFIALSLHRNSLPEVTSDLWGRSLGLLLALLGSCVLIATEPGLILQQVSQWQAELSSSWAGGLLLVAGLFLLMQPFSWLSWLSGGVKFLLPVRTLLSQLLPGWASFVLLVRFYPYLVKIGLFPVLGWMSLCSSMIIISIGLFQNQCVLSLTAWIASGFSVAFTLLAFSGCAAALSFLIGLSMVALIFSCVLAEISESHSSNHHCFWMKFFLGIAMVSGTGGFGFVSSIGGLRWILSSSSFFIFFLVFFSFGFLGWKLFWKVLSQVHQCRVSYLQILCIFLFLLLSTNLLWDGTLSGEMLIGNPDRVFGSLLYDFFLFEKSEFERSSDFFSILSCYGGGLVLTFFAAYWMNRRKEEVWNRVFESFPQTTHLIRNGYAIFGLSEYCKRMMMQVAYFSEIVIEKNLRSEVLARKLLDFFQMLSRLVLKFDFYFTQALEEGLRKSVAIPGKTLQLMQTADARWCLFFALASGFALLLHFLTRL
jgi:hypothetical protein